MDQNQTDKPSYVRLNGMVAETLPLDPMTNLISIYTVNNDRAATRLTLQRVAVAKVGEATNKAVTDLCFKK